MTMKRLYSAVLCFCLVLAVQSQTIHWLTFVDTTDEEVGKIDQDTRALFMSHFRDVVNAALATEGYAAHNLDFYGSSFTSQNCKDAITSLKPEKDDIVVFYYIGHGTHAAREDNPYPQLLFNSPNPKYFIPLKWVYEELKKSPARLTLTIGMCCNAIQGAPPKKMPAFAARDFTYNSGNTYMTEAEVNRIQKIFLEQKGHKIYASAKVGELSQCDIFTFRSDMIMDTFTGCFLKQFENVKKGETLTWNSFLSAVSDNVVTRQKRKLADYPEFKDSLLASGAQSPYQTPFGEGTVVTCPRPIVKRPVPDPNEIETGVLLHFGLSLISDKSFPYEQRKTTADKLLMLFSPDAKVLTVGQDGDVVVDIDTPKNFLRRIAISNVLINVQLVEYETDDNDMVTEIRVKEYYKQSNKKK